MELKAVCTRLLINVVLLLAVQDEKLCCAKKEDAVFPLLDPNRLQFFEYESIQLKCGGLDFPSGWRVMRRIDEKNTNASQWKTFVGSGNTTLAFASDSGEYWCENKEGERSSSVNITVTDGEVILESPSVPVMEGESVTLKCRKNTADPNLAAEFFKDGNFLDTRYKGDLTISSVSKSDEGFYKCSISGAEESPQSWLSVRGETKDQTPDNTDVSQDRAQTPSTDGSPPPFIILPVVLTLLCVAGLLLVVGLLQCRKHTVACFSSVTSTTQENSVSQEARVADESGLTYAVVNKFYKKREKDTPHCSANRPSKGGYRLSLGGDDVVYSSVR